MTEHEFMPEMDDDDPILLPGGEIHTVGEARADRKLERRINFANFMRSGLRDKLVRILQRPALDRRGQLWVLREDAVALALAAFDKIEELERRRRSKGGKNHGPKVRTNTAAKYEKEWGEPVRDLLKAPGTISAEHIHRRLVKKGMASERQLRTVERFVGKIKKENWR